MSTRRFEQELSLALEQQRLLVALAEDKGFLALSSLVQEQADNLQQDILFTPCTGVDSAMAQEYKKGSLEGRLAWENVRTAMISSLEININRLRSLVNDNPDGTPDGNNAP